MRHAKVFKEESGRWVVELRSPDFTLATWSHSTWEIALETAIRWVDFRG